MSIEFCSVPLGDDLNMIGLRPHKLRPSLRISAAALLVVWLAAIGLCSTDCMGDDCHADTANIKKAATTNGQSHDADSHDDSLCVSLHSVCPATPSATFIKPDFGLAFTLDFISTRQIVAVTLPETFISSQPVSAEPVAPEILARGRQLFTQNCVSCHGTLGDGQSVAGAALSPAPTNFKWQQPDLDHALQALRDGIPGTAMPGWKDQISETNRVALAHYVRSLYAPPQPSER
jgi:mono/diheme cytochrome c family protein